MGEKVKLREICHSRSGNKGDGVNIGIAVYNLDHYEWVKDHLTEEAVGEYLKEITPGPITRFELSNLGALNFIVPDVLDGSQSAAPILDTLGKSFGSILLDMEIEAPDGLRNSDFGFQIEKKPYKIPQSPIRNRFVWGVAPPTVGITLRLP